VDIAAEPELIDGVVPGDGLTGVCRFLRRLTEGGRNGAE
jgi:hypothetical protein